MKRKYFTFETLVIFILVLVIVSSVIADNLLGLHFYRLFEKSGQHFSLLAESFLKGKLYFLRIDQMGLIDLVEQNGLYYWPLGPFPAILVIPFVFLSKILHFPFYQSYLHIFLSVGIFILCYKLANRFGYKRNDSLFLAFAFCFASIYSYVVLDSRSWYFSQAIGVFFSLLALYEFYDQRRWFLIGIFTSFLFATRFTAGFIIFFFLFYIVFSKHKREIKLKSLFKLMLPVATIGVLLILYNQMRFGNFFDTGYSRPFIRPEFQRLMKERYGLFGLDNIVTNTYWYFLAPIFPVVESDTYHLVFPYFSVSPIGLSFFITSPIFIFTFRNTWKNLEQKLLWITSAVILFILLTYYASGYYQFGPRYTLDFLPALFVLLLYSFKKRKLSFKVRTLIIMSALFNTILILYYMEYVKFSL